MTSRNSRRRARQSAQIKSLTSRLAGSLPARSRSRSRARSRSRSRTRVVFDTVDDPGTVRATKATDRGLFRRNADFMSEGSVVPYNPRFASAASSKAGAAGLPPVIASYIDPFSPNAGGVRYPDAFQGLSDTTTTTSVISLVTAPAAGTAFSDANMATVATPDAGTALFLFTPDPSNYLVQGVCGTPGSGGLSGLAHSFVWPNGIVYTGGAGSANSFGGGTGNNDVDNVVSNIGSLRALYAGLRMVSGGVKLTSTLNFSSVSGTIHIAPVFVNMSTMVGVGSVVPAGAATAPNQQMNGWQPSLPVNLPALSNLPGYKQYPLSALETDEVMSIFARCGEESLLFKPSGTPWGMDANNTGHTATRYGDANVPDNYGHYCLCVFVDGVTTSSGSPAAALTPIMEAEFRGHYECQINPATVLSVGASTFYGSLGPDAKHAAPHQPLLQAASDNMAAAVPAVRCVDEAGVEESNFVEEVVRIWRNVCSVVTTVRGAVDVVAPLLGALAI